MTKNTKFVGLDVHAATVVIAVAEVGGEVRSLGTIVNEIGAIRRVLGKLGKKEQLRVCYERLVLRGLRLLGPDSPGDRMRGHRTFTYPEGGE